MYKVLIIINAHQLSNQGTVVASSPATQRMMATLKDAITIQSEEELPVTVIGAQQLLNQSNPYNPNDPSWICCPLTIELPPEFEFPGAKLFRTCRDIKGTRQWVEDNLHLRTGNGIKQVWHGNYWLPIVLTAKGPMYGEVIGEGELPNSYQQPVEFPDKKRQSLYGLGYQLLESMSAQPAVYLIQFGFQDETLIFDRIWPFPAAPALASIGVQTPNLYSCHWQCLSQQPIWDLLTSSAIK